MASPTDASQLLRSGVLEGVSVLLAGGHAVAGSVESPGAGVYAACSRLGARISAPQALNAGEALGAEEEEIEKAIDDVLAQHARIDLLVVDGGGLFACAKDGNGGEQGARAALAGSLQAIWRLTRALVNRAYLGRERGGRIVYLAPPPGAGEHAEPARAGLENLARTLSIEWARHDITVVTIAPGTTTPASEVAVLTAYLASPAGAYFSGCLLDLRGVPPARGPSSGERR